VVVNSGTSTTGINEIEVQSLDVSGRMMVSGGSATLSILGTSVAVAATNIVDTFAAKGVTGGVDRIRIQGYNEAGTAFNTTILVTAALTFTEIAAAMSSALFTSANGSVSIAATGKILVSMTAALSVAITDFSFEDVDNSGSVLDLGFTDTIALPAATNSTTFGTAYLQGASVALTANGTRTLDSVAGGINTIGTTTTGKLDVRFANTITAGTSDTLTFNTKGENELAQYGTIVQTSAVAGDYVFQISAVTNETYRITNLTTGSISSTISINGAGTAANLDLDSFQGLQLSFDAILTQGETAIMHVSTNNVLQAQLSTELKSISRFMDEGVFLGRDTVELGIAIPGVGETTRIFINATDTISDLVGKISLAIANPNSFNDLDMETTMAGGHYADLVHFNLTGPARGTISITSPHPGMNLVFTGDEGLLNALSLMDVQQAQNAKYNVSVVNIHTGELVEQVETTTGYLDGILQGVQIKLDTSQGYKLDPNGTADHVEAPYNQDAIAAPTVSITSDFVGTNFIHIVPHKIQFQIGANQGQDIDVAIGEMTASGLGVKGLLMADSGSSQNAIGTVDSAIDKVSSLRANLGAIQNRLESTIRNLDVSKQNLAAAESGIRDLNVASATIDFTRQQILLQAGTAVLAQANALSQNVLMLLR
jgi:flagellin